MANLMTAELKERIANEYAKVYKAGSHMHKYCMGFSDAVELSNGFFFVVEKPRIETSFCFGYRLSQYDTEEYDSANRCVESTYADGGEFFKAKNLEGFKKELDILKSGNPISVMRNYSKTSHGEVNISTSFYDYDAYTSYYPFDKDNMFILSDGDVALLIKLYENELAKFEKRLNAYLKRYGTSKLKSWSYWSEA